jgi:CheY-like chemotaxis protein
MVIIDFNMPDMDGGQLAEAIKQESEIASIPLVLLHSLGQKGDAQRFSQVGFDAYLAKPVNSETLRRTLSGVLGLTAKGEEHPLLTRHKVSESASSTNKPITFNGRILLVEDIQANQIVAGSMLKKLGLTVDIAENGQVALDRAADSIYDIIFMDCQMPVMDGYEATRKLRQRQQVLGIHTPIIALTANALKDQRRKGLSIGMDDYIAKPFNSSDLVIVLRKWLTGNQIVEDADSAPQQAELQASNSNEQPTLDPEQYNAMREALGEDFPALVTAFRQSLKEIIDALHHGEGEKDLKEIERLGHSIKSASLNVGATRLAQLGIALEAQCRENRLHDLSGQLTAIEGEYAQAEEALDALPG